MEKNYHEVNNLCLLEQNLFCDFETKCKNCKTATLYEKKVFKDRIRKATVTFGAVTIAIATVVTPANAVSGIGDIVYDPSNYAQNLETAIQAAKQVTNQYTQIQNQFLSLANEAKNLLPDQTNTTGLQTAFKNLMSMQNYINGLVDDYTMSQAAWDRTYPGFKDYNGGVSASEYAKRARTTWQTSNDMTKNSATVNAMARKNGQITAGEVDKLMKASQNSQGALQAAQVGNSLAAAQAQQLQQLIDVASASADAQNAYNMEIIQNRSLENEQRDSFQKWGESLEEKKQYTKPKGYIW